MQSAARMKVIDLHEDQTGQWKSLLSRRYTPEAKLVTQVSTILSEVQLRGDQALVEFAQRFDHADLTAAGTGGHRSRNADRAGVDKT